MSIENKIQQEREDGKKTEGSMENCFSVDQEEEVVEDKLCLKNSSFREMEVLVVLV